MTKITSPDTNPELNKGSVEVPREKLEQIMSLAKMGEGDLLYKNDPKSARIHLTTIYNELKEILK